MWVWPKVHGKGFDTAAHDLRPTEQGKRGGIRGQAGPVVCGGNISNRFPVFRFIKTGKFISYKSIGPLSFSVGEFFVVFSFFGRRFADLLADWENLPIYLFLKYFDTVGIEISF